MASLEFDIGLGDFPEPGTFSSKVSSMVSMIKSTLLRITGSCTYSDSNVFIILRDFLQPNTALTLESVVESLIDLLPENASGSARVYSFGTVCLDLAEQIPYHHPSHQKMARLLECIGKSTKVNGEIVFKVTTRAELTHLFLLTFYFNLGEVDDL
jgi:hypothetical protein